MNGDLSRVTFDQLKHYTRVVTQQGRVQLDADANEQIAILLHYLQTLAADLIGPHGGPADIIQGGALERRNNGFAIIGARAEFIDKDPIIGAAEKAELKKLADAAKSQFLIASGRYYVDGWLCENETNIPYNRQPDNPLRKEETVLDPGSYLVYLDAWERSITSLEDPSIREVALGGADTAARTKLIWQVRVNRISIGDPPADCTEFDPSLMSGLQPSNRGRIQAKAKEDAGVDDESPCTISPDARFRGRENQLYRVEIHHGGPAVKSGSEAPATFKWSRDNGTIVAPIKKKIGDDLIVNGLRDASRWFTAGNWVEITHDALELTGRPGTMVRLLTVQGETLAIDPKTTSETVYDPQSTFNGLPPAKVKVRRWDQQMQEHPLRDGTIPITEGEWIELEDGVMIRFEKDSDAQYRTGDYWLIPARASTGDVEWPTAALKPGNLGEATIEAQALAPHGVEHHYAPLAAITVDGGTVTKVVDLRHEFRAAGVCRK